MLCLSYCFIFGIFVDETKDIKVNDLSLQHAMNNLNCLKKSFRIDSLSKLSVDQTLVYQVGFLSPKMIHRSVFSE